jgi:hypothetical protein
VALGSDRGSGKSAYVTSRWTAPWSTKLGGCRSIRVDVYSGSESTKPNLPTPALFSKLKCEVQCEAPQCRRYCRGSRAARTLLGHAGYHFGLCEHGHVCFVHMHRGWPPPCAPASSSLATKSPCRHKSNAPFVCEGRGDLGDPGDLAAERVPLDVVRRRRLSRVPARVLPTFGVLFFVPSAAGLTPGESNSCAP